MPYYFQEQVDGVPASAFQKLASHALIGETQFAPPGFAVAARYGTVAILERTPPAAAYRRLDKDAREPRQKGVEDRFAPTVRPRF